MTTDSASGENTLLDEVREQLSNNIEQMRKRGYTSVTPLSRLQGYYSSLQNKTGMSFPAWTSIVVYERTVLSWDFDGEPLAAKGPWIPTWVYLLLLWEQDRSGRRGRDEMHEIAKMMVTGFSGDLETVEIYLAGRELEKLD